MNCRQALAQQNDRARAFSLGTLLSGVVVISGGITLLSGLTRGSVGRIGLGLLQGYLGWNGAQACANLYNINQDPEQVTDIFGVSPTRVIRAVSQNTFGFGWAVDLIVRGIDVQGWRLPFGCRSCRG